jgi:flagellin
MISMHTNAAAAAALNTLRSLDSDRLRSQSEASSGLRIANSSDNAAYWSIATTMRSDNKAMSSVKDALGFGSAVVDVAYTGLSNVIDVLSDFKAKLVMASEPGVSLSKVQKELTQLKEQVSHIATASSFNGVNWLNTDIADIFDEKLSTTSLVSSFVRTGSDQVSVETADVMLSRFSLFNSAGGGLLQADPRDLKTVGGLRYITNTHDDGTNVMSSNALHNTGGSRPGHQQFGFTGPFTFGAGDNITFDIIVDAEDPATISGPHAPGMTRTVVIDKATVDAALGTTDGVIGDYKAYASVINTAMSAAGATATSYATTYVTWDDVDKKYVDVPDVIGFGSREASGLNGSSIQIASVSSTLGTAGLAPTGINYGPRRAEMTIDFQPFSVYSDLTVSFSFRVENEPATTYTFDKDDVNALLGVTDGTVATSDDMAILLNALINRPDISITSDGAGTISIVPDDTIHRKAGSRSSIGFTGVSVSNEPLANKNFLDIDIEQHPDMVASYLTYIETVSAKAIDGAATLGAMQKRLEIQTDFTETLMATSDRGVGRLVDANMNQTSTRLKALETQKQLASQALQIANSNSENILSLFRA